MRNEGRHRAGAWLWKKSSSPPFQGGVPAERAGWLQNASGYPSDMLARLCMMVLMLLAAPIASAANARPDSVIDLVYLGGPDCPYCRRWEANELPKLQRMEEFRHIRFTHVLKRIPEPVPKPAALPDHLKPYYDQMVRQTGGRRGSPQFVLLLDGIAVGGGFGTGAYHDLMPTLTGLVTQKTGKLMPYTEAMGNGR